MFYNFDETEWWLQKEGLLSHVLKGNDIGRTLRFSLKYNFVIMSKILQKTYNSPARRKGF